jgi:ribonucleotide reductase alpha subunit
VSYDDTQRPCCSCCAAVDPSSGCALSSRIYFAALTASTDLSRQERDSRRAEAALLGKSVEEIEAIQGWYDSYPGSPMSQGRVQFNMWKVRVNPNDPSDLRERFMNDTTDHSGRWDWVALKREIAEVGVRNSLLLAPMPTASTSQILGNNEWSVVVQEKGPGGGRGSRADVAVL